MLFDNYKKYPHATIRPHLLWEYDLNKFNFQKMKNIVIQRVIERGNFQDWYFMLNKYPLNEIKQTIKSLPYLNPKDMNFVHVVFQIPLNQMKCFIKKQSTTIHWNC